MQVYVQDESLSPLVIDVYREIVGNAVPWHCRKHNLIIPKPDSELYNGHLRDVRRARFCL